MVSNALDIDLAELNATLDRLRWAHQDDAEYLELRSALPADWPL
ncbi:MAG TPA: hypothetical protein VF937_04125 [Chloroflexota bacterium]